MYPFNEDYRDALKYQIHDYALSGTIGDKTFTENDISMLTISNRIADDNTVSIGSVYMAELHITFLKSLGIAWKQSKGWEITVEEGLWVNAEDGYVYIPGGHFFIDDVQTTKEGIEVTAYDAMNKFEKTTTGITVRNNTLPTILEQVCTRCGVTLANESFSGFPNSSTTFSLSTENDIENCRDLLSWVAQTMASFATINRDGELELRMYKATNSYDDEVDADARADSYVFNNYVTRYTGISVVDQKRQQTKYYAEEVDDGLTYNLGTNPFMQGIAEARRQAVCMAILDAMQNIAYTPFSIDCLPSFAYDLGDVINFDIESQNPRYGCIMLWDYRYNASVNFQGLGADPALASAKSKTDKNLSGILNQVESTKEYMYSFSNGEDITTGITWQTVLKQRFGTVSATWAMFHGEMLCEALGDTVVEVRYLLDNEEVQRYPVETWKQGKHILSLMYPITVGSQDFHNWMVQIRSLDASVSILTDNAIGVIKGQGLAASDVWNGYIDLDDEYTLLNTVEESELLTFTDTASVGTLIPIAQNFSESYSLLDATDDSELVDYLDVYAFNKNFHNRLTWDESAQMTWDQSEAFYVWGLDRE